MDTSSFHTNTKNPLLIAILLAGLLYVAGQYVGSLPERIRADQERRPEITVQGTAKVTAAPDIATIQLGVHVEAQDTAEAATEALAEQMNAMLAYIREQGIEDKDISTAQLSVNPSYNFTQDGRELTGYEANQTVTVKVRDTGKVGQLVSGSAALGANQIGSVQFTTDDPRALTQEAQAEAIADARTRAEALANALGGKLGKVIRFEAQGQPTQPPFFAQRADTLESAGGVIEAPPGESEINATVTVTYELR